VVTLELPQARRLAGSVVLGQAAITVAAAIICFVVWGNTAGWSALAGGGISTLASFVMVLLSFRRSSQSSPMHAVLGLFVGEAAKLVTVIVLFILVLRTLTVSPAAMLGTFAATLVIYWVALANALPALRKSAA
jgi:ATP synthase protein I